MRTVTRGERPPRLNNPPLSDDAWKLMYQCWAHDKRLRPGITEVVETIESWKRPPVHSLSLPSISQSPDSVPRGSALGHEVVAPLSISDSTSGGFSNRSSPAKTSPPKKTEKSTFYNCLARAYRIIRMNINKGGKRAQVLDINERAYNAGETKIL